MAVRRSLLRVAMVVLAALSASAEEPPSASPVDVRLELAQQFFYAGEPLWVRITVRNAADAEIANPITTPLVRGFRVAADAGALTAAKEPKIDEPARPDKLAPLSFYGAVIDLARVFPALAEAGSYTIHWSSNGLLSDQLLVRVIPKYSPGKEYRAAIETSEGTIELGFFKEQSPIAVKAFLDMAQAGFYDGLLIHEARGDAFIAGGNPAFGEPRDRHPITFPAEQSALPLVSGAVVLKPVGASPPANGPEFVILLRPQPAWSGQATVLGHVVKGFDVAQAISRVPTSGQTERPFFKPLKDIVIQRVRVTELPPPPSASR